MKNTNPSGLTFEEWVLAAGVAVFNGDVVRPYSESWQSPVEHSAEDIRLGRRCFTDRRRMRKNVTRYYSEKIRRAWREGDDPTDWRASSPPPVPHPIERYTAPPNEPIPSDVQVGQFVRARWGCLLLWRVVAVFEPNSPYILAVQVTRSKYHTPGDREELLSKDKNMIEPNPVDYSKYCYKAFDVNDLWVNHKK